MTKHLIELTESFTNNKILISVEDIVYIQRDAVRKTVTVTIDFHYGERKIVVVESYDDIKNFIISIWR